MKTPIRNAFVLGAGLGTRLRALTARKPKPLLPICGRPLITFAFDHLIRNGCERLVINTHHCPEAYLETFPNGSYRGLPLHFEHESTLLETGGGIKNIEQRVRNETFTIYNGDVLCDLPIEKAVDHHFAQRNEVTLILRSVGGPLHIGLDPDTSRVIDIADRLQRGAAAKYMFTGIYVVSPSFLLKIPSRTKISVIPIFLNMIKKNQALGGIVIDEGNWWDLGTREKYLEVHRYFAEEDFSFECDRRSLRDTPWPEWIHPEAIISPNAQINGATAIGARAKVAADAKLTDCVVWEDARIEAGADLRNCIVTAGQTASGTHTDFDF